MQLQGRTPQKQYFVHEASVVGEARRDAQRLAKESGLDETWTGRVAIVVTELATNLHRHAKDGELLLQPIHTDAGTQVEVLAIDRGPGMNDVRQCIRDGYSTGGTAGTGLGAVRRLSAVFDAYSQPGQGSAIVARVGPGRSPAFGAICTAIRGESVSGDSWRLASDEGELSSIVFDGLGHGQLAADAARIGSEAFCVAPFDSPEAHLQRSHERLSGTRGAAGACVRRWRDGRLSFAGIGNISARACGAERSQGLVSHNGTLGLQTRRVQQFEYPSQGDALLVLHSDGLSARWDLDTYPGLRVHHPALVAAVLYRDHGRRRDDATVLVVGHG